MKTKMCVVLALLAGAAGAQAGIVGHALTIEATNTTGTGHFTIDAPADNAWVDGKWSATIPNIDLRNDMGEVVSSLQDLTISFVDDPVVTVNFTAVGGAGPTAFTFSSGLLVFAPMVNPTGSASAGYSLTDRDGNGASVVGAYSGNAYRADYNGLVPGGIQYATLAPDLSFAAPFFTQVSSSATTGGVAGTVSGMSAEFSFTVSANDLVSGTSVFQLVPTPGALAVAGMGGLLAARRRRA